MKNPVLDNEIKRNTRKMRTSWILFGVNVMLLAVLGVMYAGSLSGKNYRTVGELSEPLQAYLMVAVLLFAAVCFLVPGISGGSIALERDRRTLDLLLTTSLSPWKIILGKLEASLLMIAWIAIAAIPVEALLLIPGGISPMDLISLTGILVICGIFVGSIGIFFSSICRKSTTAMIASYVMILLLIVGTLAFVLAAYYLASLRANQSEVYVPTDIGNVVYVLLLNPLVTFYCFISHQIGNGGEFAQLCAGFGDYEGNFVVHHMLEISLAVQLLISVLLCVLACKAVDPLHKNRKKG